LISCAVVLPAGCTAGGIVHVDYLKLKPASIAVLSVENETVHPLDQMSFGGLLQRAVIGAQVENIPELLRGGLEEALVQKGYELGSPGAAAAGGGTDWRKPLPAGTQEPSFDAVLTAAIESWHAEAGGATSFSMRYRIEMYRVPSAEPLFSGTFYCDHRDDIRARGADDVPGAIRRSARRALASLPSAKE
jgi:hypothetical protein